MSKNDENDYLFLVKLVCITDIPTILFLKQRVCVCETHMYITEEYTWKSKFIH